MVRVIVSTPAGVMVAVRVCVALPARLVAVTVTLAVPAATPVSLTTEPLVETVSLASSLDVAL